MTERRPSDDNASSGEPPDAPEGQPANKSRTPRTLPMGSLQAEIRARTAAGQTPSAARAGEPKPPVTPPAASPRPNPFPEERTVKRPYPAGWDEAREAEKIPDASAQRDRPAPHAPPAQHSPPPRRSEPAPGAYRVPSPYPPRVSPRPERGSKTFLIPGSQPGPVTPPLAGSAGAPPRPSFDPRASASPLPQHLVGKSREPRPTSGGVPPARTRAGGGNAHGHKPPSRAPGSPQRHSESVQLQLDQGDLAPDPHPPVRRRRERKPSAWIALGITSAVLGFLTLLWSRFQPPPEMIANPSDGSAGALAPGLVAESPAAVPATAAPASAVPSTADSPVRAPQLAPNNAPPPTAAKLTDEPRTSDAKEPSARPAAPSTPPAAAGAVEASEEAAKANAADGVTDREADLLKAGEPPEQPTPVEPKPNAPAVVAPAPVAQGPAPAPTPARPSKPASPTASDNAAVSKQSSARESRREARARTRPVREAIIPAESSARAPATEASIEDARKALEALQGDQVDDSDPPAPPPSPSADDEPPAP
jgi:hypothetical protein